MHIQRGFVGVGALIAIVLGLVVVGGGAYYVVNQQPTSQTTPEDFDNLQQLPTTNNQQRTQSNTGAPVQTAPTNNQISQPETSSGANSALRVETYKVSDYIRDNKNSSHWTIQNGKIVSSWYTSPNCVVPAEDISDAITLKTDIKYLVANDVLFYVCDKVGTIDIENLRQLNGPRGGEVVLYDGKSVVIAGKVQSVLDAKTFASVDHKGPDTLGGTEYFKDSKAVYYGGGSTLVKLSNADPSTFSIFERGPVESVPEEGNTTARYAKDKNQAYYNGTILPTKNLGEFGVFGNGSFAIDESSIYVYGKPIMTGIRKQDIEVHYSNRDEFFEYGGTLDFLIKRNDTNKWYHYKWSEKTLSEIAAPASTKIEARLFPQP